MAGLPDRKRPLFLEEWWDWTKQWAQYFNPTEYDLGPLEIVNEGNDVLNAGLGIYKFAPDRCQWDNYVNTNDDNDANFNPPKWKAN